MARKANLVQALAYLRTSSATNVSADQDSHKRQRAAIDAYAKKAGFEIVEEFYDAAVDGSGYITDRPGFAAMMDRIAGNGVRTIIVETSNRFARDLIVQETGYALPRDQGITLIAADKPDAFLDDTPTAVLIRQVVAAASQFEKAMVTTKLTGARDRKRRETGRKVEGRKSYAERDAEMVARARRLRGDGVRPAMSLREIANTLFAEGYGAMKAGLVVGPFNASSVKRILE